MSLRPSSVRGAAAAVALLVAVGCGSETATSTGTAPPSTDPAGSPSTEPTSTAATDVELTQGGACADAFFWASTPSGDVAVTVTVEARDRSTTEPTTIPLSLPQPDATVEVLRGQGMSINFCNDVLDPSAEPTETLGAVAGEGQILLDPNAGPSEGEPVTGTLSLDGLEAEDGTTFAPIGVTSDSIGFYAG